MLPLKIAIQVRSLKLPLKRALPLARRLGASAVELDARGELNPQLLTRTGLRQLLKLLDDLELTVAAVGFPTRRGYGVADDLDRRVGATKAAMTMARELRCSLVVNQVGRVPTDTDSPEWGNMVAALGDLAHHAHHAGAWLSAETGTESGADLKRLVDALPPGALPVTFDPGNLLVNGFSPGEAVETLGSHIVHVHANDAVRDLAIGRGVRVQLGRGSIDFAALLGTLEQFGYRGHVSIERQDADDPAGEIAQAVEYLQTLFRG